MFLKLLLLIFLSYLIRLQICKVDALSLRVPYTYHYKRGKSVASYLIFVVIFVQEVKDSTKCLPVNLNWDDFSTQVYFQLCAATRGYAFLKKGFFIKGFKLCNLVF